MTESSTELAYDSKTELSLPICTAGKPGMPDGMRGCDAAIAPSDVWPAVCELCCMIGSHLFRSSVSLDSIHRRYALVEGSQIANVPLQGSNALLKLHCLRTFGLICLMQALKGRQQLCMSELKSCVFISQLLIAK